ncbi:MULTISPECIES: LytTR family DNA-binding domain-containing protein [unclassified Actinomyces]|uniref:LytR/AlgR family response regulator transcription factor n=1 Tax=unclassified Actinomyces TaxID=2609248 RepID=UPI00137AD63D|nr:MULTISPECIES: LytTR family DNA-binding domain-containing protein [unclassified Actinomyces]MBW3070097.1 response regulator transcription factor [Actinomyces sp. 594]NDR52506.1 response regulator transcription factor [Actinomyces sp. 565]
MKVNTSPSATLRIGVVDDDARHRNVLSEYLDRFGRERGLDLQVSVFEAGGDILDGFRPIYDILMLDIRMEGTDGLSLARLVRRIDPDVIIIFITAAQQYAINGYEVSALGYLVKPFPYSSLARELSRALEVLGRRDNAGIVLKDGQGLRRVPVRDIVYLESSGHRLDVHLTDGAITLTGSLKQMEPKLAPHGFFRSNSCYIVNLRHVVAVREQDSVMSTGQSLRISRPRKKEFMRALAEHVSGTTA